MNRDQIITESIQKLLKMLLEKEKTTKNIHCIAGPSANSARGLFDLLLLGPEPDSQRPGHRKGPPRHRPPVRMGRAPAQDAETRSWPSMKIGWQATRSAGSKPSDAGSSHKP